MIACIHQPQYLPWLPYFLKIQKSDLFVILDSVDFQKNGLQNRNQIKIDQGAHWLTVPIIHRHGQKILNTQIDNYSVWRRKHWLAIQNNYGKSPSYSKYKEDLQSIYERDWIGLCDLNIEIIKMMMGWMNIKTPIVRSSQLESEGSGSNLVLNLCLEVGATQYISGSGGKDYLDSEAFQNKGIDIIYQDNVLPKQYPQRFLNAGFINTLSAVDIIFNCGEDWDRHCFIDGK